MSATATRTNWNGMTRNDISTGIFDTLNGAASEVRLLNAYEHPAHPGSADWTVYLYEYTLNSFKSRVFATNGAPIWEEGQPDEFKTTLTEYGIED